MSNVQKAFQILFQFIGRIKEKPGNNNQSEYIFSFKALNIFLESISFHRLNVCGLAKNLDKLKKRDRL